jgi:hypothetical protein
MAFAEEEQTRLTHSGDFWGEGHQSPALLKLHHFVEGSELRFI